MELSVSEPALGTPWPGLGKWSTPFGARWAICPLTELTELVLQESGYLPQLEAQGDEDAKMRIENLREFLSVTKQFETEGVPHRFGRLLRTRGLD